MNSIDFSKIRIFSYLDEQTIDMLKKQFIPITIEKDEFVIDYGDEVPGLYVLVKGEVVVLGKDHVTPLATPAGGSSFGELSFLGAGF